MYIIFTYNTAKCNVIRYRYSTVQYITILHEERQCRLQVRKIRQTLDSHKKISSRNSSANYWMCLVNNFGEKRPCYNGTVLYIYRHLSIGSLIHVVNCQGSPCRCQVRCLNPQGTQPSVQFTHSGWKYPRYATSGTLGAWRLPHRRQVKPRGTNQGWLEAPHAQIPTQHRASNTRIQAGVWHGLLFRLTGSGRCASN